MPGFLIPMAGLAFGALGRLVNQRRSARALASATGSATANTPSETSLSTAASGSATGTSQTGPISQPRTGPQIAPRAHTPGQGPNTQGSRGAFNQGSSSGGQDTSTGSTGSETPAQRNARLAASGQGPAVQGQLGDDEASKAPPKHGVLTASELGAASIARSRKKNKDQQAALSGAALT